MYPNNFSLLRIWLLNTFCHTMAPCMTKLNMQAKHPLVMSQWWCDDVLRLSSSTPCVLMEHFLQCQSRWGLHVHAHAASKALEWATLRLSSSKRIQIWERRTNKVQIVGGTENGGEADPLADSPPTRSMLQLGESVCQASSFRATIGPLMSHPLSFGGFPSWQGQERNTNDYRLTMTEKKRTVPFHRSTLREPPHRDQLCAFMRYPESKDDFSLTICELHSGCTQKTQSVVGKV